MSKLIDEIGNRYNRLIVVERAPSPDKRTFWRCRCDCGNITDVWAKYLRNGHTRSCGCLIIDTSKSCGSINGKSNNLRHGCARDGRRSKEYKIWIAMVDRCYNQNNDHYKDYGGRGILICERWRESFTNFLEDMGECPDGMTIERINNDGHYELNNTRWANQHDQHRNMRTNVWVELNGERMIMGDAVMMLGVNSRALYHYKNINGLTHQQTIDHFSEAVR